MSTPGKTELVRQELVKLRNRAGIRQQRIKDKCPTICALDAVRDEAERRGLEPEVAAFEVIRCAIDRITRGPMRLILGYTLNVDDGENYGDFLEDRRQVLFETVVPLSSDSQRKAREAEAYQELASLLTRAEESPCSWDRPDPDDPEYLIPPPPELDPRPADERDRVDAVTIVFNISIEPSHEVAGDFAVKLLDLLSGIKPAGKIDRATAERHLRYMLKMTEYVASNTKDARRRQGLTGSPSLDELQEHAWVATQALIGRASDLLGSRSAGEGREEYREYLLQRCLSVVVVASFWQALEANSRWSDYPELAAVRKT